nr:hypothetical protein MACL_00001353 [Theileria orientalis]
MPFCYETLVDSGEADYVYFGSFVRPASKDVLIVKESKLIIYTLTQTNTEVLFDDDLKLTKKLARLSENGLVEHVLEYPFFGCVLSCCTLKQLIYTQTDNNESYVSTGSKRKKLNRSALSGYIDGIVLLMDDGNLLICYFNAKEFDIKIASSYTFRGYENLNDPDLNYETHMAVYEHKWEINNQINNEKVYSKNYLLVFTRKQTEINFMVLQSMYSSVRGCSVTVDKEGTGGAKGPGDPGRYCNTDEGHGDGVGVDNGGNGAQNTSVSGTATSATDTGPKLLLSGQSTFDINGKFNLSNSFIKNVTFIEGYYMPIVGLLITSYPEKIGNSAYNCYSGLSKWQNLGKKGTKDSAKDESVVSCSLLVLNIDLLTLNISIINRIDNLFIDTIGVRGFCYDDFVGFVCHNNDYLLWFKLFNSSVYYQLMNVYALFHPRLAHLASRGSKVSRDKLINNMNLNVELSDYRMEVIDSTCRQWDGIEEGQEGRKEAGGMSQEQGDRVSEKDAKFVLLLPAVAGKSVYYGRLVYRSGTIVNIEWSAVSVSSASKSASAEQVCGNHFDVLPISERDLLMATTSSSNLMQMLVLSRPTSASVTNGTGVATNGVSLLMVSVLPLKPLPPKVVPELLLLLPMVLMVAGVSLQCLLNVKSTGFLRSLNNFKFSPWVEVDVSSQSDMRSATVERGTGGLRSGERSGGELNYVIGIRNEKEIVEMVRKPLYYLQAVLGGEGRGDGIGLSVADSSEKSDERKLVYGKHAVTLNRKGLHIKDIGGTVTGSSSGSASVTGAADKHEEQLMLTFVHTGKVYRVYSSGVLVGGGEERVPLIGSADAKVVQCENVKNHLVLLTSDNKLHSVTVTDGSATAAKSKSEATPTKSGSRKTAKTPKARKADTEKEENEPVKVVKNVKAFNKVVGKGSYVSFLTVEDHLYLYNLETNESVFHLEGLHELNSMLRISYSSGDESVGYASNVSNTASSTDGNGNTATSTDRNGVGAGVGVERAQEEILMCYLTSVEDCLYLVLLISGHCIYVYQHYGRTFKLVQHKHIQPYPSLLLCESTPEDELGESTPVYKLVPRVRSHRVHSSELVTCPVVDVDKSQVVKFSREGSLDRGGEAREELKEVELTEEERDAVVEKFKARFEGFKWEIYTLKSSQKKLVIYSIQLVGVSSMLYVGEGGTGSSGDKDVKNTKDVNGEAASLCTDELYLDEGALYLLSGRDSRLYVYEMSDHFDYYYGKFSHEVYEGLKVAHHSRLNVLYSGEGATNGGIGGASNGRIGGSTNAITDGGSNGRIGGASNGRIGGASNGVTSGTTNAITDGGSNASGGTSGTGDNYILGDNYFVKTFSFDGGLRRVFQSVNLMSVSSRYYRYNKENNTIREATPGMSEHVAHAALRVGVMGSGTATGPKEAVGKLIALVVTVREDSLENYYNLLNTRNKLQLIHIDKEATKLDKLLVNRHLKVHIQYYQVLSSMSSSDTAYGAMGSDTVDGGVTAGGRANATVPTNNKANATVQSSGKAISGSQGSGKANPTVPSSGKANAGANGSGKANAGANGSGKADTTMVDLEEDNMIVTQDYVVLLHSSDLENILSYYKLDTFESVLSIKFGQIYERELILVGTNTNLGEYVESKGDVLILDFLHFDPLTLHHATIGGSRRGHSSRVGSGRNALDGEEALRQSRKAPLRKMALHYKKSFLYPITYVSTLESEMTVPFSPEYFTSADEDCGGVSGSGGGMKDGDGEGDGGALGPGGRENANLGQDSATARSTASNRLKDEQWLRNQFTDETNHIVHSVGSNIYIHEMKDVYSNQMIVRGAFNDLFTSISAISVFNKFLLIGDVLKGLSFFMYIYDSSNDSKNIIRIASTNPKINLPILSCSPLINRNTLTLLASDDNGNLLQFVPSNNINTDKDKLIIIGGVKFNNNIAQMLKYQDDVEYSIMAVGSCGSLYKVSMSSEDRFDFVKKFENAYESCRKNRLNIKHSCRSNLNLTKQMVNLQESIPTASQSVVSLDLLRDFYHENAEFYRNLMAKLNLNPYSLYDLFNFVYEEFY